MIAKDDKKFKGSHQELKRQHFERYFKNFRYELENGEVRLIARKWNVLNQALYQE